MARTISLQHEPTPADIQAMRYPPSVLSYECARNIVREERGGMVYVYVDNLADFNRILNFEQAEREREYRRGLYAQHAAEAYAGGTP